MEGAVYAGDYESLEEKGRKSNRELRKLLFSMRGKNKPEMSQQIMGHSFDLATRNAIVIGRVDPESEFFVGIIDRVMAIMSYSEDDEGEWDEETK